MKALTNCNSITPITSISNTVKIKPYPCGLLVVASKSKYLNNRADHGKGSVRVQMKKI